MIPAIPEAPETKSYKAFTKWAFQNGAHYVEPTTLGQRGYGRVLMSAIAVDQAAGETVAVWVKDKGLVYKSRRLPLPASILSAMGLTTTSEGRLHAQPRE